VCVLISDYQFLSLIDYTTIIIRLSPEFFKPTTGAVVVAVISLTA